MLWAAREKRTIITYDKDFGELVFKLGNRHYGVILVRVRDESHRMQLKLIEDFLAAHNPKEIQAHFWILTEATTRQAHK